MVLPQEHHGLQGAKGKEDTLDFGRAVLVFPAVVVPNVALFFLFSGLGSGLTVFNQVAPYSLYGDFCFGIAALTCAVFYVLNWPNWTRCVQMCSLVVPWCFGSVGTVLKGRKYPWGPMLMCMALIVILIGAIRSGPCKHTNRKMYYRVTYVCTALSGVILASLWLGWVMQGKNWDLGMEEEWASMTSAIYENVYSARALNYTQDCGTAANLTALSTEERGRVKTACTAAGTVLFMVWACPFIGAACNFAIAAFVCLNGVVPNFGGNKTKLESDLKRFVLFLTVVLMGMYGSVSLSGISVSLGNTLMAFFMASMVALAGWVYLELYLELGQQAITDEIGKTKFAGMVNDAITKDWVKAGFVGAFGVFIPVFFVLEKARQRVGLRACMRRSGEGHDGDPVTKRTNMIISKLSEFYWVGILMKICLLGELFFVFQVGVAKATYVFLSFLNSVLASFDFGLVVVIIFVIGYIMFLLPPVPGVPVYVFAGVVLGDQGAKNKSIGFFLGCLIAVAVAWGLKLVACCGQYCIGFFAGKSLQVQMLIGVDKVLTRAIEMILKSNGLAPGKVAVLVGGPDWPVSVTCGILRMSVGQMLLGTAPVLFVLAPCVLAGAFLTRVTGSEESIWNVLANVFLSASVVVQMGSMFMAVYKTTEVVDKHGEELARPREDHKKVEDLRRKEEEDTKAYMEATRWDELHFFYKILHVAAAGLMVLQGFIFAFLDELCFENFSVSGKIGDPLDEGGLGGSVWNIVIQPLGSLTLAIFGVACVLHIICVKAMQGKGLSAAQLSAARLFAESQSAHALGASTGRATGTKVVRAAAANVRHAGSPLRSDLVATRTNDPP